MYKCGKSSKGNIIRLVLFTHSVCDGSISRVIK